MEGTMNMQSEKRNMRRCLYILLAGAILANLKSILSDYDIDIEYALVTSYRMLQGDRMFTQMWEPHQTSAFLTTFLMWIYHSLFGTWTGIVVYLHSMGVLLQGAVGILTYRVLSRRIQPFTAACMSIFFFAYRPKAIVFPEFSNMQIGFSVLLFLFLIKFFEDQKHRRWLIMGSVCLCLQILSYPSCLLVYIFAVVLICMYSERKFYNAALFTGCCFLQGVCYLLFFVSRIGVNEFAANLLNIVNADKTHGESAMWTGDYYKYLAGGVIWLLGCLAAALLAEAVLRIWRNKRKVPCTRELMWNNILAVFFLLLFVSEVVRIFIYRDRFSYITAFLAVILLGRMGLKHCEPDEKRIYTVGMLLSAGSFLATLVLTNLDIVSVVAYLVLAVMVSFLPICRWLRKDRAMSIAVMFCAMIIAHRGLIAKTIDGEPTNIFDLRGIVRSGPAVGMVTRYMGAYEINCNMEDWKKYVRQGDRLLMVADNINTLGYMYEDVDISVHSTICTATYDEMLLKYWNQNPEKYPNVIAVSCWYGQLRISEESWIYQWIQEEFQPSTYVDGRYWRFYRREDI